jgi:hypothetical protein
MESLASRISSATLQLRFAQNDNDDEGDRGKRARRPAQLVR